MNTPYPHPRYRFFLACAFSMLASSASFAQGKKSSPIATAQAVIGQPLTIVERTFRRGGFSWSQTYDNRYIIFKASKGGASYDMTFTRRSRDNKLICEDITITSAQKRFLTLAPRNWSKQEIYIGTNVTQNRSDHTIFLISRNRNGSYLRWSFPLSSQNKVLQCVPVGNRWKLTIKPNWPTSLVDSYYSLTLRGVNFDRSYSGAEAPTEEAYSPGYYEKIRADGKAVRWRKGDREKVVYFPRQH